MVLFAEFLCMNRRWRSLVSRSGRVVSSIHWTGYDKSAFDLNKIMSQKSRDSNAIIACKRKSKPIQGENVVKMH